LKRDYRFSRCFSGFPAWKNSRRCSRRSWTLYALSRERASTLATMHRAVSRDGFCANNLARKPSRHRSLFVCTIRQLYHMGLRKAVARSVLADANESRDGRIRADFAQVLIRKAQNLYAAEPLELELSDTVYTLDSTTIDLCFSVFPWANFRSTKAAIKMHTLLDCAVPFRVSFRLAMESFATSMCSISHPGGGRLLRHGSRVHRFREIVCIVSGWYVLCCTD